MSWIPPEEFYKSVPKKWAGVAILFCDSQGHFLLVKPSYGKFWTPVGGIVDAAESPRQAITREVKEEIGLEIQPPKLLVIEYQKAQDTVMGDRFHFVFDGGVLNDYEIRSIMLSPDELTDYGFFSDEQCVEMLGPENGARVAVMQRIRKAGLLTYLES